MASNRAHQRGFSLLELIIVLMVMISLLAIAWPNLQRPLRRTSLSEAAQALRSAIDDSRYQAITSGSPVFLQLRQGNEVIRSGTFDSFMNDDIDSLSAGSSLQPATIKPPVDPRRSTGSQAAIRSWTLPKSVVISDVRWTLETPTDEFELSESTAEPTSQVAEVNSDAMIANNIGQASDFLGGVSGQTWWLPLVATGQGRDASIVLLDTSIDEEVTITFASATGALEIVK